MAQAHALKQAILSFPQLNLNRRDGIYTYKLAAQLSNLATAPKKSNGKKPNERPPQQNA